MPEKHVHQSKQLIAQRSLSHLQAAETRSQHADWIVTLAFYKALHAVDSYLADFDIHPTRHGGDNGRNDSVRNRLQDIYVQYATLYNASQNARYEDFTYENKPQEVDILLNMSMQIVDYINTQ